MENDSEYKVTTDHDEIRNWLEEHSAIPAILNRKENDGEGVLAIKFKESDTALEGISWQEFLDRFESSRLALRYDGEIGEPGMFSYNFIHRDLIENNELSGNENEVNDHEMPEDDIPVENIFPSASDDPRSPDYPGVTTDEGQSDAL